MHIQPLQVSMMLANSTNLGATSEAQPQYGLSSDYAQTAPAIDLRGFSTPSCAYLRFALHIGVDVTGIQFHYAKSGERGTVSHVTVFDRK
jgi:hypothetical protein